jgi:lipoprotein-anchoring transpeptidase ErfK/SrfK
VQERRAHWDGTGLRLPAAFACAALVVAVACAAIGVDSAAAAAPTAVCPAWVTTATATPTAGAPVATAVGPAMVGSTSAVLTVSVDAGAGPVSLTAEYSQAGSPPACALVRTPQQDTVQLVLRGLRPSTRYSVQLALKSGANVTLSKSGTLVTLAQATIAQGVTVGETPVGRMDRAAAVTVLNHSVGQPLRLTYAGARWQVLPSRVGAHVDIAGAVAAALAAIPGQQLPPLKVAVDSNVLHSYVAALNLRWSRKPAQASVRLVGKHAVVTAAQPGVTVQTTRLATQIEHELATGERTLLSLGVQTTRKPAAATPQKAVVVRLGSQTLTAYLNGKPVLETPVTTGRPALPTPIGSFSVLNRNSPYVFHSPWPPGNPFYYPPTPVTWAMEFYDGDFLHDDPGEPDSDFGSDSQNGYFASHGCVHIPHDAMAFLYNWLPVGAPVIVAQD